MTSPIIYKVSVAAATAAQPILCLLAFLYCYRRRNPRYMRSFPIYTTVSMVPTFFMLYMPRYEKMSYFIFPQFELLYFTYFLTRVFIDKRTGKLLWLFAPIWVIFSVVRMWNDHFRLNLFGDIGITIIGEALIINLGCIEYIRQIMSNPIIPNLHREPSFWMVCATLCYFVTMLSTVVFTYFAEANQKAYLGEIFWSVNNFSEIISSGLYIVAMFCTGSRRAIFSERSRTPTIGSGIAAKLGNLMEGLIGGGGRDKQK